MKQRAVKLNMQPCASTVCIYRVSNKDCTVFPKKLLVRE